MPMTRQKEKAGGQAQEAAAAGASQAGGRQVRFAPGPLSSKYRTQDGHPDREGEIARPKRSLGQSWGHDLTPSSIKELEAQLGEECRPSLDRLKRRVGLLPLRKRPKEYLSWMIDSSSGSGSSSEGSEDEELRPALKRHKTKQQQQQQQQQQQRRQQVAQPAGLEGPEAAQPSRQLAGEGTAEGKPPKQQRRKQPQSTNKATRGAAMVSAALGAQAAGAAGGAALGGRKPRQKAAGAAAAAAAALSQQGRLEPPNHNATGLAWPQRPAMLLGSGAPPRLHPAARAQPPAALVSEKGSRPATLPAVTQTFRSKGGAKAGQGAKQLEATAGPAAANGAAAAAGTACIAGTAQAAASDSWSSDASLAQAASPLLGAAAGQQGLVWLVLGGALPPSGGGSSSSVGQGQKRSQRLGALSDPVGKARAGGLKS